MVTKTEALYRALLPLSVVSFDDIVEKASLVLGVAPSRGYVYRKYVDRLVRSGRLRRIRKGLYVVLSPAEESGGHAVDKLLIASKIRDDYYLGFHTALEYYGCANSLFNEAYVCVKARDRFDSFRYGRFSFRPVFVGDTAFEVEEKSYRGSLVRVSSRERTFVECVDRVRYAGGWEECLKSLEGLGGLDVDKLPYLLSTYGNVTLAKKVGYILELLREYSPFYEHVTEELLRDIERQASGPPRYLVNREKGFLNRRWNLYVPEGFEEKLRGI